MKKVRVRWGSDKHYRWKLGSGRWWALFAGGLIIAALIKGFPSQQAAPGLDLNAAAKGVEPQRQEQQQQQKPATASPMTQTSFVESAQDAVLHDYDRLRIQVYLTADKRMERLPIELYVRGVIAAEMPIEFELEALKAQAIAARTYIYRRLYAGTSGDLPAAAMTADVTDTVKHQVYLSLDRLLNRWKDERKRVNLEKLNRAVEETKGQIVTYNGEPIQAAFFSTSNGYTENAVDYWSLDLPYLRSVASPWDKDISPRYKETVTMKLSEFASKLGVKRSEIQSMRILKTTEGRRIKQLAIGKKIYSGREVREKLALASSQFRWTIDSDVISITTYGFGHGVGMSQWGANGMAQAGSKAEQIIKHYYTGTQVEQASKLPIPGTS
ncbi:stage II sporulation protein D [Paenibacillus oenotherae]|uniref:Stage II sporulation protein D n=1 Tax=Paenibacillus oenotherae TaxID=1435645 RepID=A0ABS7D791_9BACL|nr:stage II sporulation protein D [Paenibacillus oenotherae]MBW7475028.1 stage II sporulation protein D [Paenibacillus oenotherae]